MHEGNAHTWHWRLSGGARRRRRPASTAASRAGESVPTRSADDGSLPRVARLMALALKFDGLLAAGRVTDYADLARLGRVTRARMTQVMNLLNLAPDIQEEILFLPRTKAGRDSITERDLRGVTQQIAWEDQRRAWRRLTGQGFEISPLPRHE